MNIEAKPGDKVRFIYPWWGITHDQEQAAKLLTIGEVYTVEHVDVHSSSSTVYLQEVPGKGFNTVLFADDSKPITLSRLLELLSLSVRHPGVEEVHHKAHETACDWIAQQVKALETRVRELEAGKDATSVTSSKGGGQAGTGFFTYGCERCGGFHRNVRYEWEPQPDGTVKHIGLVGVDCKGPTPQEGRDKP